MYLVDEVKEMLGMAVSRLGDGYWRYGGCDRYLGVRAYIRAYDRLAEPHSANQTIVTLLYTKPTLSHHAAQLIYYT